MGNGYKEGNMSLSNKNKNHPHKCKVCGLSDIEHAFAICRVCGWEDDIIQNDDKNYIGGANNMSFNQYKQFWEKNKEDILKNNKNDLFYVFDKADKFYKQNFEEGNLKYLSEIEPDYDRKMQQAEENRRKRELERQQKKIKKTNSYDESE